MCDQITGGMELLHTLNEKCYLLQLVTCCGVALFFWFIMGGNRDIMRETGCSVRIQKWVHDATMCQIFMKYMTEPGIQLHLKGEEIIQAILQ